MKRTDWQGTRIRLTVSVMQELILRANEVIE